jgi:hypothetical protein
MTNLNSIKTSIISGYNSVDWKEVQFIVTEGLKITIALMITIGIYVVEGTISSYKWLSPRLANLLQHPYQTIIQGPAILYGESLPPMMIGTPTIGEKYVIKIGSFVYTLIGYIDSFSYDQLKTDLKEVLHM